MKRSLQKRIEQALQEEGEKEPDLALLNLLRALACEDSQYFKLPPEKRNALNDWFEEVKDLLLQEMLNGEYGAQILLDSFFIMCFEVGYQLAQLEALKERGELT